MIPVGFAIALAAVCLLAWRARDADLQKLSLVLLAGWALTNAAEALCGFREAPVYMAVSDGVSAVYVLWLIGKPSTSLAARWASIMVLLAFLVMGAEHVVALGMKSAGTRRYYDVLGYMFAVQLLLVGGASGTRLRLGFLGRGSGFRRHSPVRISRREEGAS